MEKQKPCISVIIPVYNVEQYLQRCVDSVLGQTLDDLEVILVDDGSPDNSPAICDRYSACDERIKVIHKENGGLASARNAGMKEASGDYIFFLDSDDWLESDGLKLLYDTAKEYNVDFVRYRAIRTGWPGLPDNAPVMLEPIREMQGGYYDKNRIIEEVYPRLLATCQLTMGPIVGAWGSLYKTEFLINKQLYFYESVKVGEDLIFSAHVVRKADSFYYIDTACVYHYFYNSNSISKSFRKDRWESCRETIRLVKDGFGNDKEYDFSDQLLYVQWFCTVLALNERKRLDTFKERKTYCRGILKSNEVKQLKLSNSLEIGLKQKIELYIIKLRLAGVLALI